MTFQKSLLLSALIGSVVLVHSAPVASSTCSVDTHVWGAITTKEGLAVSTSDSGSIVVGGRPQQFMTGTCQTQDEARNTKDTKGYLVNAYDNSKCLTVSQLERSGATFSFEQCQFDKGSISPSQSFAWYATSKEFLGKLFFSGENSSFVNASQFTSYSLKAKDGPNSDLIVDYDSNPTSLPEPFTVHVRPQYNSLPAQFDCSLKTAGKLFYNAQSSQNADPAYHGYEGPITVDWSATQASSDRLQFVFETCDYSWAGFNASDEFEYGRLRREEDIEQGINNCFELASGWTATGSSNEPTSNEPFNIFFRTNCADFKNDYPEHQIARLSKADNKIDYIPFKANQSTPGKLEWFKAKEYSTGYGVNVSQTDDAVGQVYLSADSIKSDYPPANVTFVANN